MKRKLLMLAPLLLILAAGLFAQETPDAGEGGNTQAAKYMAAALAVGLACLAGGIAVGRIGAAALGAMSENPELSGKALPFIGLAEGICLWGFLVGLLILIL
jgi:V/A-type H+-transporting ATPase subunit K